MAQIPNKYASNWRCVGEECGLPVLIVPSVLIPAEANYRLNPNHSEFGQLEIGEPVPFAFDPRLTG